MRQMAQPQTQSSSSGASAATSQSRLVVLRQRKAELEQILGDKTSLLQQLMRQEAQIVGINSFDPPPMILTNWQSNGDSQDTDAVSVVAATSTSNTSTSLRRKVATGFRLPDSILAVGNENDDLQQLMVGKQVQQQISDASLKLANDVNQTKSIRRAHKQNFDSAQTKLQSINLALSVAIAKKQQQQMRAASASNGNLSQSSGQADHHQQQQRRNSMVSTNSAHQYLTAGTTPSVKSLRVRHDSYNNNTNNGGPVSPALSSTATVYNQHYHHTSSGQLSGVPTSPSYDYAVRHIPKAASTLLPHISTPPPPPLHERSLNQMVSSPPFSRSITQRSNIDTDNVSQLNQNHQLNPIDNNFYYTDSTNSTVRGRLGSCSSRERGGATTPDQQHHLVVMSNGGGLGGYWATAEETGERVWCSVDSSTSNVGAGNSRQVLNFCWFGYISNNRFFV